MPLTGVFETTDGALVLVGAFKANPLRDICAALGLPDLSADPRFATFAEQVEHKAELHAMFRERFATDTTATLARAARGAGPAVRAGARPCARRWPIAQTLHNGDDRSTATAERPQRCASSVTPDQHVGRRRSACAARRRAWASTPTRCWASCARRPHRRAAAPR